MKVSKKSKGEEIGAEVINLGSGQSNLLRVDEAAVYLNIKISKLRAMVFRNEIQFLKIGRLVRFHRQDIERWLLTQRAASSGNQAEFRVTNSIPLFEIDTHFSKANSKGFP